MAECLHVASTRVAPGDLGDFEDRTLEGIGNVEIPVLVEDQSVGNAGTGAERNRVRAAVGVAHGARSRRADSRNDRNVLEVAQIRGDALDLGCDAHEVPDVGDVDLIVVAVEFQAEQRLAEVAL